MARTLGPLTLPSTCTAALGDAYFLPNAPREYRSGVHQGADFMCRRTGETAVAALPGRVVMAHSGWTEPTFGDRQSLLDQAAVLGRTPDSTLTLLYGRHVVLDHGLIPDVGHVVTVSAHLDSIDPAVVLGTMVEAGQPIGVIGASGTSEASDGSNDTSDHHLHWELYVDDQYLGAGLNGAETVELYQLLLGL